MGLAEIPPHVPHERVVDFDIYQPPGVEMEIIAFMREWLSRMPEFRLDPDRKVIMKGGNIGTCIALPLRWDADVSAARSQAGSAADLGSAGSP